MNAISSSSETESEYDPNLYAFIETCLAFMADMYDHFPERHEVDDHYSLLLRAFFLKQSEHGQSVLRLRMSPDSQLIARSMLEGVAFLKYATADRIRVPLRWLEFEAVSRLKLATFLHKHQALDLSEDIKRIRAQLEDSGDKFYTPEAKKAKNNNKPLPADPYSEAWHDKTVSKLIAALATPEKEDILRQFYRASSEYHHWGVGALLKDLSLDDTEGGNLKGSFRSMSGREYNQVLRVSSLCLMLTIKQCHKHWALKIEPQLVLLEDRMLTTLGYTRAEVEAMPQDLFDLDE